MSRECVLSAASQTESYILIHPEGTDQYVLYKELGADRGQVKVVEFFDLEILTDFLCYWMAANSDWGINFRFVSPWLAKELNI